MELRPWRTIAVLIAWCLSSGVGVVRNLSCSNATEVGTVTDLNALLFSGPTRSRFDSRWFEYCSAPGNQSCLLKAAVILPQNASWYEVALPKVLPVLELAVEHAKRRRYLPQGLTVMFADFDDKCDAVHGQISAVEAYATDKPHVFFGPFCEYSCAPVARMAKFWNIPILTAGAMTYDFKKNKTDCENEYHLLVRTGLVDFEQITHAIIAILQRHDWRRLRLVYEKDGYNRISGLHSCKLMMETLVNSLKKHNILYTPLDLETTRQDGLHKGLKELAMEYGGYEHTPRDNSAAVAKLATSNCWISPLCVLSILY